MPGDPAKFFAGYELLDEGREGGMGVVHRARQPGLNRIVALKMIRFRHRLRPAELERFQIEAEATAALTHDHIVRIYEMGKDGERPYFSMEWMSGGHLQDQMQALQGQPMPAPRAVEIMMTVARAVHHAHERGVLHRDLTPRNILFDAEGVPHVSDFGLARLINESSELTNPGQGLGTPGYPSPEQALGQLDRLGPASDVFSLGAILYQLLTGRPAFPTANWLDFIRHVADATPPRPASINPAIDSDLEAICLKCLAREPAARYASAVELADQLQRCLRGQPVRTSAGGWGASLVQWCQRHRAVAGLMVLIAVGLGGAAVAANHWWQQRAVVAREAAFASNFPQRWEEILVLRDKLEFEPALRQLAKLKPTPPGDLEVLTLTANLQASLFRFQDAVTSYQNLLARSAGEPFARENAELCRTLRGLQATRPNSEAFTNALGDLLDLMQQQQRHAEAVVLQRKLPTRSARHLKQWRERLVNAGFEQARVAAMTVDADGLLKLDLGGSVVRDLAPLRGLPIKTLNLQRTKVTDLTPLRGMPLTYLNLGHVAVDDWSPIRSLPLKSLQLYSARIRDLSAVACPSLESLNIGETQVVDLQPLAGLPIKLLELYGSQVKDLKPLIGLPIATLAVEGCRRLTDLSPITNLPLRSLAVDAGTNDLSPLWKLRLTRLVIRKSSAIDLSRLTNMPLTEVEIHDAKPELDLGWLKRSPVRTLSLVRCGLLSLEQLGELPLDKLSLNGTPVVSLEFLRGSPVRALNLAGSTVQDLSPLTNCPRLASVLLPGTATNVSVLRGVPQLRRLSDRENAAGEPAETPAEYWRRVGPVQPD